MKQHDIEGSMRRHVFAIILITYLGLATCYSVATPLWEAPDEPYHIAYALQLASGGGLPVLDAAAPGPCRQEGGQPPLYYALVALVLRAVPLDSYDLDIRLNPQADLGVVMPDGNSNYTVHTDAEGWPYHGMVLAAHLARLCSVLLGAVTVTAAWLLAREVLPQQPEVAGIAAALVAFNPMFLFLSGAINNDSLTIALASLCLWTLVRALVRPPSLRGWFSIGLLFALSGLSKLSALILAIPIGLVALVLAVRDERRHLWQAALGLLVPALALLGWWFWRNWRLYGDPSALTPFLAIIGRRHPTPTLRQLWGERQGFALSLIGVFGWMNVRAPDWAYWLLGLSGGLGLLASPLGIWRLKQADELLPNRAGQFVLLGLWPLILLASLVRWTLMTPATQGRLLFPALTCLSFWIALGWGALAAPPIRRYILGAVPVLWLAVALAVPWITIAPAYRPPEALSREAAPGCASVDADMGAGITLVAAELPQQSFAPGEWVPLRLCWSAQASPDTDWSVYLHLVGTDERIVAQRDRYPLNGLLPTSLWAPGRVYCEDWAAHLPQTLYTPDTLRVMIGIYNQQDSMRPQESTELGTILVPQNSAGEVPNPLDIRFGTDIALAGYTVDRLEAAQGETIRLLLYWRALHDGHDNLSVFTQLRDGSGRVLAQHDGWPQGGERPTASWRQGDLIVDEHLLTVAEDAPAGVWNLYIGLYDSQGHRLTVLGDQGQATSNELLLAPLRVLQP